MSRNEGVSDLVYKTCRKTLMFESGATQMSLCGGVYRRVFSGSMAALGGLMQTLTYQCTTKLWV
jgi:hypothetical protein